MSDVTDRAALLADIDRLCALCREIDDEEYDYAEKIEQLIYYAIRAAVKDSADHYADARAEIDRLRAREIVMAQHEDTGRTWNGPRCAIPSRYFEVNTAEREVGRDL